MQRDTHDGLTRREALKRGAVIAGGLVWATPVVQAVGMSRAYANDTSPVPKSCCEGSGVKLATLTMKYLGGENDCSKSNYTQDPSLVSCTDYPPSLLPSTPHIVASHQENIFDSTGAIDDKKRIWFNGVVGTGAEFVIDAINATETELKGETWVHIFYDTPSLANYRQKVGFHTSCSEPLFTGDQFGSVVLVDCTSATDAAPVAEPLTEEPAARPTRVWTRKYPSNSLVRPSRVAKPGLPGVCLLTVSRSWPKCPLQLASCPEVKRTQ